ncbi:MAG TPA: MBL fold metallo-hydrolase [Dinghuibacter sp.]|uniref:MBL fold metallo-hydrolase n=1 Tax=Dinghuibacter sp. TaxID=2024697 RepID=UPI002B84F4CC|nr:MBL fold metallo-hydrolase [Dinghuibacter sp.]HTJ14585.1 MBL fold metallo-hydrolase [Dinghuibacter sp.]
MTLDVTFLGTGTSTGVPMIACPCAVCHSTDARDKRLRSSILVETPSSSIVIDTTPDFRTQMLRIGLTTLHAVVFTHPHKDHIAGLDDVRAFNFFMQAPMHVYANAMTEETLKREFGYAFADKRYPGVPEIILHTIDDRPFIVRELTFIPIQVWHYKMPVYGFRIGDFTYITDANRIEEAEREKIRGSKVLVLNALRRESHISHFTLTEAIALADELGVEQAYFTHISHQLGLHAEVSRELPPGRALAYDGLRLTV